MVRNRAIEIAKGVGALAGLLAVGGGVPWVLLDLGEGLPASLPSQRAIADWAGHPISDSALLRGVGLICWALWAMFVAAVVVEIAGVAARRLDGRRRARGPTGSKGWGDGEGGAGRGRRVEWRASGGRRGLRIPGFQRVAGAFVVTAMLVVPRSTGVGHARRALSPTPTSLSVSRSQPIPQPPLAGPAATRIGGWGPDSEVSSEVSSEVGYGAAHVGAGPGAAREQPAGREAGGRAASEAGWDRYVVRRYDSPWAIAERHLGDGYRWRELRDESGMPLWPSAHTEGNESYRRDHLKFGQARARHQQRGRARYIHPGEILLIPRASGHGGKAHAAPSPSGAAATTPAAVAEAATARASATAPAGTATTGLTPLAAAGSRSASAGGPSQLGRSLSPLVAAVDVPGINGVAGRRAEAPAGISLLEAGLVSASVFSILEMLRRRQSQRRPFGRRIRLPSGPDVQTELALRGGRRPEVADRIQRAVHSLYATTTASGEPLPAILGAVADGDAVEMLLATPTLPPSPWESAAGGFAWRVRDENLREAVPPFSEPLPALAPLGKAVGTGADVIVNLEAAGVIGVTGDPQRASGIIRAIAASLSGLPWAEAISLVLAGFGDELHAAPQARVIPGVGAVLAELRSTVAVMDEMLTRHGCATIWDARTRGLAGDGWPPTVVLCAEPPPDADVAELVSLAALRRGVVAVVPAAIGRQQGWTLDADLVPMTVGPLRVAVEPTVLRVTELAAVGRVLDAAEDEAGATLDEPPYDRIELRSDWPEPPEGAPEENGAATMSGHKVEAPGLPPREDGRLDERDVEAPGPPPREDAAGHMGEGRHQTPPRARQAAVLAGLPLAPAAAQVALDLRQPAVLIRVLGSVELDGATNFSRAKSRELAVYLAMHPNGVGESELDEALWPSELGRVVPPSTRDSTVSVARTALGGPARLLPAQGQGREKRYQLAAEVGSDFDLFCRLHRHGRAVMSIDSLRAALGLVRGRPFEGVLSGRNYTWVHTEGHARHLEAEVGDAADMAATLLLEAGQPLEARWAARQGLAADPLCERLWIRLMQAADDLGESQEIERLMDELDIAFELGGDFSGLHPNTLAAYDRYRRGNRPRRS